MGLIKAKSDGLDVSSHTNSVLNTAYFINENYNFGLDNRILKWSVILHDVGKANPLFQKNMTTNNFDNVCRHEISSILFIKVVPEDIRDQVAFIILSHHKSIIDDNRSIMKLYDERPDILYKNHIGDIQVWGIQVKEFLSNYYNIEMEIPTYDECVEILDYYCDKIKELPNGMSEYRGLFMIADHFASCYENDVERLNILNSLIKPLNLDYYNNKDSKYPLSLINSDTTKKHTFLIAPTGCGKTNFVLKRCIKEDKNQINRIFYTLPFQASINAMYNRIKKELGNDFYMGIKHASSNYLSFVDTTSKDLSNLFGLPIEILTPFQLMSILIGTKGYESVAMDIKGQNIILDEIHTYSDDALYAVVQLVKILKQLNCSIHICTATMPTKFQNEIINILGEENTQMVKLDDDVLNSFDRHIIHTLNHFDYNEIKKHYNNGEKVLVVRNTIRSAIDTYREIIRTIHPKKCLLLHSRFKRSRKAEIESLLINDFNKSTEPCIVVSTQVVEVSLDINFDVLFTDCADIMSLIQRFGRINRQRTDTTIKKPIYVSEWHNESRFVIYPNNICDKTFSALQKFENCVLKENKIQSVIDSVHDDFNIVSANVFSPYDKNGIWKYKLYSNNMNMNLSKALQINSNIVIKQSDLNYYLQTKDKSIEIPMIGHRVRDINLVEYRNKDNEVEFYIAPDFLYSDEVGLA